MCCAEVLDDRSPPSARGCAGAVCRNRAIAARAFAGLVLGVVADRLLDPEVGVVGRVVGEHVEDEPLLDRLPHRVQVERHEPVRRPGRGVPNSSSVRAFGVAVNAKKLQVRLPPTRRRLPARGSPRRHRAASSSARSAASAAARSPRRLGLRRATSFKSFAASPVCEECASSTITA